MIKLTQLLNESNDYEVYHNTYSSAMGASRTWIEKRGYVVTDDEWFQEVSTGNPKPSKGKTNRISLQLMKGDKLQKKQAHIQVYNRGVSGNTYELNAYIN